MFSQMNPGQILDSICSLVTSHPTFRKRSRFQVAERRKCNTVWRRSFCLPPVFSRSKIVREPAQPLSTIFPPTICKMHVRTTTGTLPTSSIFAEAVRLDRFGCSGSEASRSTSPHWNLTLVREATMVNAVASVSKDASLNCD
jgi:hypothetical protein